MKRLVLALAAATLAAALVPTASLAKGASEATITGPGLGDGINLAGEGQPGGMTLMRLAESAGFFPSVFETTPNPMLSKRPKGELGPRYRIAYTMPGPNGTISELEQELYPYATPNALSYMKPGQRFWDDQRTIGGWYIGASTLEDRLLAVGLPKTPPSGGGFDFPWTLVAAFALGAGILGTALATVHIRRRPRPATA